MPDRRRVEDFIRMVVSGAHVRAIEDFYWEDASMRENTKPPRRGRELLVAHEAAALQRVARMHTHPVETFLLDGDRVVIHWTFDITDAQGVTRRMEELSLQRWRGERIAEERFFYDPGSIQPIAAGAG
jgi:ketosteroid isomerase-like protein